MGEEEKAWKLIVKQRDHTLRHRLRKTDYFLSFFRPKFDFISFYCSIGDLFHFNISNWNFQKIAVTKTVDGRQRF